MVGGYTEVLDQSLMERIQTEDPLVIAFFRGPRPGERNKRAVEFERWVTADLDANSGPADVQETAKLVSDDLVTTPVRLMLEILLGEPRLLPVQPTWIDGSALTHTFDRRRDKHRFGVIGGNRSIATGDFVSDLTRAYARLLAMNLADPFTKDELLHVICSPEIADTFRMAQSRVRFKFDVLTHPHFCSVDPWFLMRDRQPVGIKITKPQTPPASRDGSFMRLGARYSIWVDNPASVIRVDQPVA